MSTSKFAGLAALSALPRPAPTPREEGAVAVSSVQTSLFSRLKRAKGGPLAGKLSWMLVRAGTPGHPDSEAALAALATFPITDLRMFAIVAAAARDSLPGVAARALAAGVVGAVEGAACFGAEPGSGVLPTSPR